MEESERQREQRVCDGVLESMYDRLALSLAKVAANQSFLYKWYYIELLYIHILKFVEGRYILNTLCEARK